MLKEALKARLPLITCYTSDPFYAQDIIKYLSGAGSVSVVKELRPGQFAGSRHPFVVDYGGSRSDWREVIDENNEHGRTTIVVNPTEPILEAFDAGEVPVPKRMVLSALKDYATAKQAKELVMAMSGLTLSQVHNICRVGQATYGKLSLDNVASLRRGITGTVAGVQAVDTHLPHYEPEKDVDTWIDSTGPFLTMDDIDSRLRPRGLLMAGAPGTGKTLSAKRIAGTLGIPLYRLDVGALQSKYVGESEHNLRRALTTISRNDPCVMLIDEVEKLFSGTDDSGVTKNLLAGLLWWLQEHDHKVLTVMTTNNLKVLPPELVRPGRIDKVFQFKELFGKQIEVYVAGLLESLGLEKDLPGLPVWASGSKKKFAHAEVTAFVIEHVRRHVLEKSS